MKVYIINSITKSYILNIKIRQIVNEYALMIKLADGTSSSHSLNPDAYFGHSWSYFDVQNLRLVILYLFPFTHYSHFFLPVYQKIKSARNVNTPHRLLIEKRICFNNHFLINNCIEDEKHVQHMKIASVFI